MSNERFQNALKRVPQKVPPIWFMRQAGRYHAHYQSLRAKHSFMELCKVPELAAETTLGPIRDFDFDVAILFSDLLFPLEGLGLGLEYTDAGPRLDWHLKTSADLKKLKPKEEALHLLGFQKEAMKATRALLPKDKSLIGFVGGPWTLFAYASQGTHGGNLLEAKKAMPLFAGFNEALLPLLEENIRLQFEGGAEVVMVFDTAAGELSALEFRTQVVPGLERLARKYPGRLGYYSKQTVWEHLAGTPLVEAGLWAGLGVDHRWDLPALFPRLKSGFVQGNFDQSFLFSDTADFERLSDAYLRPFLALTPEQRAGWVSGLGHGVLPKTPELHVRRLVDKVREACSRA
jgi:uroporphyrinogen decarboxylase